MNEEALLDSAHPGYGNQILVAAWAAWTRIQEARVLALILNYSIGGDGGITLHTRHLLRVR